MVSPAKPRRDGHGETQEADHSKSQTRRQAGCEKESGGKENGDTEERGDSKEGWRQKTGRQETCRKKTGNRQADCPHLGPPAGQESPFGRARSRAAPGPPQGAAAIA